MNLTIDGALMKKLKAWIKKNRGDLVLMILLIVVATAIVVRMQSL